MGLLDVINGTHTFVHTNTCTYSFSTQPTEVNRGLANKQPKKLIIKREPCEGKHTHIYGCTLDNQTSMWSYTHSIANTHILPPAHVDRHSQAFSLDKRQRRRGEKIEAERRGVEEKLDVLTPFLEPSLSNDGDIAHGSFTPSLMPLHACSTERREEGRRGGEERKRGRGGEGGGGSPSLRVTLPPFLPSFPVHALSQKHTNTLCVCVCVCRCVS